MSHYILLQFLYIKKKKNEKSYLTTPFANTWALQEREEENKINVNK